MIPDKSIGWGNTVTLLPYPDYSVARLLDLLEVKGGLRMALDVGGLVAVVVFYVLILAIGIWASRKSKKEEEKCVGSKSEVNMIGGRNINVLVGVFTMTATWVGGGYIMGTAEAVYSPSQGLIWALGPLAYLITFLLAGLFFAKPMRSQRYVTMMDPFQLRYGNSITVALLLPALISDVLWVACILAALGGTMSVILGLSSYYSIALSAAVAITYTLMGGLYSVAYTDVIQLFFMFIALWLCVPFLVLNPASSEVTLAAFFNQSQQAPLMGELKLEHAGKWIDELLLLVRFLRRRVVGTLTGEDRLVGVCVWVIRISVLLVGLAGTGLAFAEDSVFAFWLISGDLIYCVVFPQLICVLHCRCANGYGATSGYLVAVTLRLLSGEPLIRLPTALLFPGWREEGGVIHQYFPFRTLVMLSSLVCIPLASSLATLAFSHRLLPCSWDLLAALGEEERGKDGDDGKPAVTENLLAISSTSC
ncbi:high affinity choline transporter 1-like [Oncorhynchus mykiss]|uniref:high affinity choline transporter 1-like n=1 Tax=Oncorhynchus mykiss TaxID=8022 RepID=UPI00187868C0|nr:high affinity choline transporter 1-like [Oncorhynchus mykiss]